jgi:hypothetical protein
VLLVQPYAGRAAYALDDEQRLARVGAVRVGDGADEIGLHFRQVVHRQVARTAVGCRFGQGVAVGVESVQTAAGDGFGDRGAAGAAHWPVLAGDADAIAHRAIDRQPAVIAGRRRGGAIRTQVQR